MFKQLIEADYRRRGLATIVVGSTGLAILLFLSLRTIAGGGVTFWFDWDIQFFRLEEQREWLVDFSVRWLFVLCILLIALGVADRLGLFSRGSNVDSQGN